MSDRMWFNTVDYRQDRSGEAGLVNRGFWLRGTPRLMPLCRLRGHRPVVDGVNYSPCKRSRWACCDRCGIRLLQPVDDDLEIGQPYTDPLPVSPSQASDVSGARGVIGGQVVLWGGYGGVSGQVKVGNAGSEHTLAGHIHLHKLGALYLHTERHGTWLQRRLNPTGHHSRVISLGVDGGHLRWQLWARRGESVRTDPWWMQGYVDIDPRTRLWGPRRYAYTDVGEKVQAAVRMPHGDDHPVTLQLQRSAFGRERLRRKKMSWSVDWDAPAGIPTRDTDRGRIQGAVTVSDEAVTDDVWVPEACAAIAARMTRDRTRYGYKAAVPPFDEGGAA